MIRLDELVLWSIDRDRSDAFCRRAMGQVVAPPPLGGLARVRHRFRAAASSDSPAPSGQDGYWKYSVFADSVDELRREIMAAGQQVTDPVQFLDIGYLCHLHEPGGNEIELLQRTFVPQLADRSPDGHSGPATLGLITLRVSDMEATTALLGNGLGMSHLATMEVGDLTADGFCLAFLAWTDDEPPSPDPTDVVNREWLYQRPYTIIELQAGPATQSLSHATSGPGLAYISASTDDLDLVQAGLAAAGEQWEPYGHGGSDGSVGIRVTTPDGHVIEISQIV